MEHLIPVGKVQPKHSTEVVNSRIGLGFEKLDRGVFDAEKAYDKVAALGVKWIRIQSGWARTETEKGVYHWEWIDSIVDNLLLRRLRPWVCLCYGNALYSDMAKEVFGAAGVPPVHTEEEKQAWHDYVVAFVKHFKDRIHPYEVWNEPDGIWCWKTGVSAEEYGNFVCATAQAIREVDTECEIYAGSVCLRDLFFIDTALRTGMADCIDAITYHEYTADETTVFERVDTLRALAHCYNPKIDIIQGESGSQSRSDGNGALHHQSWTPSKQMRQLLRHTAADLISNVKFISYFSAMDMIEALNGKVGDQSSYMDFGYFGVIGADFDENGIASGNYTPKPSYYALQNLASIFSENFENATLPILRLPQKNIPERGYMDDHIGEVISGGFRRPNGACAFVYWTPTDLMTTTYDHFFTLQVAGIPGEIRLIDPADGTIYQIPENQIEDRGNNQKMLLHIPIRDYPLILTFGEF